MKKRTHKKLFGILLFSTICGSLVLTFQACSGFNLNEELIRNISSVDEPISNSNPTDTEVVTDTETDTGTDVVIDTEVDPGADNNPINAKLLYSTHRKIGFRGDNWTSTWADDGTPEGVTLVSMDDGLWDENDLGPSKYVSRDGFNHTIYKVKGGNKFTMSDVDRLDGFPFYELHKYCHFGYGILAVDKVWYSLVGQCGEKFFKGQSEFSLLLWGQFFGMKMLKSADQGKTWSVVKRDGGRSTDMKKINTTCQNDYDYFFCKEEETKVSIQERDRHGHSVWQDYYSFMMSTFVQAGKDYQDRTDDYIYIYSPRPNKDLTFNLELARVHKSKIEKRSEWRYFKSYNSDGSAEWTSSLSNRGQVMHYKRYANGQNWYSYLPDVVYNKPLGLYIMVNGAINNSYFNAGGTDVYSSGSLFLYYSKKPYGPWNRLNINNKSFIESFKANSSDKTYQPKLDPKRISSDGKKMHIIWSDFGGTGGFSDEHYGYHDMEIEIEFE